MSTYSSNVDQTPESGSRPVPVLFQFVCISLRMLNVGARGLQQERDGDVTL